MFAQKMLKMSHVLQSADWQIMPMGDIWDILYEQLLIKSYFTLILLQTLKN